MRETTAASESEETVPVICVVHVVCLSRLIKLQGMLVLQCSHGEVASKDGEI